MFNARNNCPRRSNGLSPLLVCLIGWAVLASVGCTIKPGDWEGFGFASDSGSDSPLSQAVFEALESRPDIPMNTIDVRADGDVVTLAGRVGNDIERQSAELVAGEVDGVRRVINSLFVTD